MTNEELEAKLLDALDRIAKLEAEVKRLDALADACPQCNGLPGMLCGTCMGTGRRSGRKSR